MCVHSMLQDHAEMDVRTTAANKILDEMAPILEPLSMKKRKASG